ncbi:hypothetical protein GB931_12485 [Modestobacter sp. I12A-02628]|uniref:PilZ domain-containing protein n=1 Tax=Goekera deserti TaxID=2497753 RepID=A0A7K3W996_9ACTN|nr:PilZ domain-containing protein [Goekera deserti]MPQ98721.1 hypothetical protein [Goekera deserti]NDI49284.1 hypothetical protein [Goekera deserti]NEL53022.1 PilZ domain-containing protein [Goekera deserti]
MADGPGDLRPGAREVVDVLGADAAEPVTGVVHESGAEHLVVSAGRLRSGARVRLDVGAALQLVWPGPAGLLGLPVELRAVRPGDEPTWALQVTGPAVPTQRRDAVRSSLRLPVRAVAGGQEQTGWAVDLSEGGLRAVFRTPPTDARGLRPRDAGSPMQVSVDVAGTVVAGRAELVRTHPRTDGAWEASVRFTDLAQKDQDVLRARVFAHLRELRAQGHV